MSDVNPSAVARLRELITEVEELTGQVPPWGATWYALGRARAELADATRHALANDGYERDRDAYLYVPGARVRVTTGPLVGRRGEVRSGLYRKGPDGQAEAMITIDGAGPEQVLMPLRELGLLTSEDPTYVAVDPAAYPARVRQL